MAGASDPGLLATAAARPPHPLDGEARLLDRVPITRVYDATPLDVLGLPVWSAVTPLARDLTVHTGKGLTAAAARTGAIMEAVERVCAEELLEGQVRLASFSRMRRELGAAVADPLDFDLPFSTGYRREREFTWVAGRELLSGREAWVALDLVLSPAREGLCLGPETNGLAAGPTYTEAVLHGLLEVVERDAAAHERFRRLYGDRERGAGERLLDHGSLPAPAVTLLAGLVDRGLSVDIRDLGHDLATPVFATTITDRSFPGREGRPVRFEGLAADLDPLSALMGSVCEAAQAHTAVLIGARESFESGDGQGPVNVDWLIRQLQRTVTPVSFDSGVAEPPPREPHRRLEVLLGRLVRVGLRRCLVVELSRTELGVPVVRVLVPGAAGPYGDTTRRPGLRLLRELV